MGRRLIKQSPRADPRVYVGKKRDRSNVWKPSRDPLLEQMKPMPPASYVKGARRVGREASFDPLRGAFIVLARPDDPEPNPPERRRGVAVVGSSKEPTQVKALLSEEESRRPAKLPAIHKRAPPEGTHMSNDLGLLMQMTELTADDKAVLWSNYQKAMELSLARDGALDGLTWRHRATHEPAPPLPHHRWPMKLTPRAPPPYGTAGECSLPAVRSGRRACKAFTSDQGERLLSWKDIPGDKVDPPPMRKLPPSYEADTHMDAMMDDKRSAQLQVPMQKQRRHIPGHSGEIGDAISPIDDRERRNLRVREMHEFTVPKKPIPPPPEMAGGIRYQRPSQALVVKCPA
eukprot:g2099.t1